MMGLLHKVQQLQAAILVGTRLVQGHRFLPECEVQYRVNGRCFETQDDFIRFRKY